MVFIQNVVVYFEHFAFYNIEYEYTTKKQNGLTIKSARNTR